MAQLVRWRYIYLSGKDIANSGVFPNGYPDCNGTQFKLGPSPSPSPSWTICQLHWREHHQPHPALCMLSHLDPVLLQQRSPLSVSRIYDVILTLAIAYAGRLGPPPAIVRPGHIQGVMGGGGRGGNI